MICIFLSWNNGKAFEINTIHYVHLKVHYDWKNILGSFYWNQHFMDFPGGSALKDLPSNEGDAGLIPGSGKFPGEGNGNPLQCSCLGNPMDRRAWQATVHGVAKSRTWLTTNTNNFYITGKERDPRLKDKQAMPSHIPCKIYLVYLNPNSDILFPILWGH